jgi:hypothetical protein
LFLVVMALFMFVAFVSYLLTGEADYSLLEQGADPFNKALQYKNACGSLGAIVAYFFLNDLSRSAPTRKLLTTFGGPS